MEKTMVYGNITEHEKEIKFLQALLEVNLETLQVMAETNRKLINELDRIKNGKE